MKIIEKFGVIEPQWILDRADSGLLFWRRDAVGNKPRYVKYLNLFLIQEIFFPKFLSFDVKDIRSNFLLPVCLSLNFILCK